MSATTGRILELLGLLQSRSVWSGPELAERLEVSVRCIRRDIDRLRDLGYPVEAARGAGGGYRLGAGRALPPLLLDGQEAVAIAVSLRLAATGTVEGVGEASLRALSKLDQVLPARLRAQVASVGEATLPLEADGPKIDVTLLLDLSRAIRDRCRVRFSYTDRTGAQTHRLVEPYRLAATRSCWYLVAYDLDRQDWRTMRLDRMDDVAATTWRFTPRPTPELGDYVRRSLRTATYDHTVTVDVAAPAEQVNARVPSTVGRATDQGGGWCRLDVGVTDFDQLAINLMRLDADLKVSDSPQLQAALRRYADRARRAAEATF